ncbi:MAG: arylsulfotransferase family protein [Paracoccaceae bacterium]
MRRWIGIVALVYLALMAGLLLGMRAVDRNWSLWQVANTTRNQFNSWLRTGYFIPKDAYARLPKDVPAARYTLVDPAKAEKGYLLVNRMDAPHVRYVVDLIERDGKMVHTWPLDFSRLDRDGNPDEFVHTAKLLPDGDLLVNFEEAKGLARLDGCGDPRCARTDQVYHHTIRPDERGGYWTVQGGSWQGGQDQRLFRFDEKTGESLEVIDLISDIIEKNDRNRLVMRIPRGFRFNGSAGPEGEDIFHINDIDPLPAALATAFPQFRPGDLLVDFRNMDLVALLDRDSHEIKWHAYGPWKMQHDPDWHVDGTITIFSIDTDRFRSSILRVHPGTGEIGEEFTASDLRFDSPVMGEHQLLPGGNWLITAAMQGRVMQVTPEGAIVQEYNNLLTDEHTMPVPYAEFIPEGYLTKMPSCP